jgi:rod shape-determining protein MreC
MTIVRARPLVVLFVLLIASAGLIVLHQVGALGPAERFAGQFIAPLQQGASRIVRVVRDVRFGLADMQRLRSENEQLRQQVAVLRSLVVGLAEVQSENSMLRDQLGFSEANPAQDLLPAQVIGRDPDSFVQTITIDKGTRDGVRDGKVVVAAGRLALPATGTVTPTTNVMVVQGLVGQVVSAGPNYARVLLITDPSSAVNVLAQGTRAEGLLEGRGRNSLLLQYVRQGEQLDPGAMLLTSGLGGAFPRGLAAGQVVSVQTNDQATFQTASATPIVDLARLDVVFVIRSFDPIRVTE